MSVLKEILKATLDTLKEIWQWISKSLGQMAKNQESWEKVGRKQEIQRKKKKQRNVTMKINWTKPSEDFFNPSSDFNNFRRN